MTWILEIHSKWCFFKSAQVPWTYFSYQQGGKDEAADESGHAEDYEPDIDFKPIIPLPDLVEVKTGEEDEIKVFGHRAKLYRYATFFCYFFWLI